MFVFHDAVKRAHSPRESPVSHDGTHRHTNRHFRPSASKGMEVVKIKNEHAEGEAGRAVLSKPGIDLKRVGVIPFELYD
jgi:hypothetical protein